MFVYICGYAEFLLFFFLFSSALFCLPLVLEASFECIDCCSTFACFHRQASVCYVALKKRKSYVYSLHYWCRYKLHVQTGFLGGKEQQQQQKTPNKIFCYSLYIAEVHVYTCVRCSEGNRMLPEVILMCGLRRNVIHVCLFNMLCK